MARLRSGILGNVRGKVSGVVGSQWKDKNYVREYVLPANPNTAAQQAQRGKMQDVVAFCKTLVGPVFNAYTDKFQKSMSGFNFFIKQSIAEFDGSPVYANLKLTEGKLFPVDKTDCVYITGTPVLNIDWVGAVGNNGADTDKVFAAVHDTSTGLWYFPAAEVARSVRLIAVVVPAGLTNTDLECYVWAINYSGTLVSMISDSVHQQATLP